MTLEQVFSLSNLMAAATRCRRGVAWKGAVQSFHLNLALNCQRLRDEVLSGTYVPRQGTPFVINERGKTRIVTPCAYRDRVVQRCLCDNALLPAVLPAVICDNHACLPGRGTHHALERLEFHLRQHWSEHGLGGGILLFDFSKYFDAIDVSVARSQFAALLADEALVDLFALCLGPGTGRLRPGCGIELGNQVSQLCAVLYPDSIDRWLCSSPVVSGYGRYMDDGYAIFPRWGDLRQTAIELEARCASLGLSLNPRKVRFVPVGEPFVFLKTVFQLLPDGTVAKRIPVRTLREHRRRMRRLWGLVERGVITPEDYARSEASWQGVLSRVGGCTVR